MAPQPLSWDALPEELVPLIGARLSTMRCYAAARGVCTTWRAELAPLAPLPCLLLVSKVGAASVHSLPMQRPFSLAKHDEDYRYLGSSDDGWLAVAYKNRPWYALDLLPDKPKPKRGKRGTSQFTVLRKKPKMEEEQPIGWKNESAAKDFYYTNFNGKDIRMDPNDISEIWYPDRDKLRLALLNPVTGKHIVLPEHVKLDLHDVIKVAFAPNPSVHDCTVVVACRPLGLAYISTRGGAHWSFGEIVSDAPIADLVYRQDPHGGDRVYCLTVAGDVHILHVPRGRSKRLVIKPLLPELEAEDFDATDVFPQPHARLSELEMGARNLAFVDGELYQVWRNNTVSFVLPDYGKGRVTVPKDEVFVLRFDPEVRPCWVEETDLRGRAVLVGPASSPMAVRAESSVPGVKGNCVYWMGKPGEGPPMVFDMEARQSTPCNIAPSSSTGRNQPMPICWLSLGKRSGSFEIS